MIDWHSHILPQIDDGSRNVSESISLVKLLVDQGVETIIATPHYYPNKESVSSFIERREISYKLLEESSTEISPKIKQLASVAAQYGKKNTITRDATAEMV